MNSAPATRTQDPNARIVGQSFTAPAVVPQTLIMQQAVSTVFTNTAVSFSRRELSAPL
jgi:hypothetical protein